MEASRSTLIEIFTFAFLLLGSKSLIAQTVYYVDSITGNNSNPGTEEAPWENISGKSSLLLPGDTVFFKRGSVWPPYVNDLGDLSGTESAKITFAAYGTGDRPVISNFRALSKNISHVVFRDLQIQEIYFRSNSFTYDNQLFLDTWESYCLPQGMSQGVCRFYNEGGWYQVTSRSTISNVKFDNILNDGGGFWHFGSMFQPSLAPDQPNTWSAGGPRAGTIRDIEITNSTFINTTGEDALNFSAVEGGIYVHHNVFENVQEEAVDIAGGINNRVEYNYIGPSTIAAGNGIKVHSQFAQVENCSIKNNVIIGGASANSFVLLNTEDCTVSNNIFYDVNNANNEIPGYSVALGDDDRTGVQEYYGSIRNTDFRNNILFGTLQILGMRRQTIDNLTTNAWGNSFNNNIYFADSVVVRFWDGDNGESVQTRFRFALNGNAETFSQWTNRENINDELACSTNPLSENYYDTTQIFSGIDWKMLYQDNPNLNPV